MLNTTQAASQPVAAPSCPRRPANRCIAAAARRVPHPRYHAPPAPVLPQPALRLGQLRFVMHPSLWVCVSRTTLERYAESQKGCTGAQFDGFQRRACPAPGARRAGAAAATVWPVDTQQGSLSALGDSKQCRHSFFPAALWGASLGVAAGPTKHQGAGRRRPGRQANCSGPGGAAAPRSSSARPGRVATLGRRPQAPHVHQGLGATRMRGRAVLLHRCSDALLSFPGALRRAHSALADPSGPAWGDRPAVAPLGPLQPVQAAPVEL